jgi:hypothetical protein
MRANLLRALIVTASKAENFSGRLSTNSIVIVFQLSLETELLFAQAFDF